MTDARLARAFSDLDRAASSVVDRDALTAAISTARRRRRRLRSFAAGMGVVGLVVAALLVVPGSQQESLVPAKVEPTPLDTYTLRAQPGRISYLPKDCVNVNSHEPPGVTHYEVYGVPHAHANKLPNPTDGDVIRFAAGLAPAVPPGDEAGSGTPVQLTHALGTYFEPSGPHNVAVFRWFDGVYNYRLQAPILNATRPVGLTYGELLKVANSVNQGTPETTEVSKPGPTPSGFLASPGPDVLRYWSPYFYATKPPQDANPKVTAEQAVTIDRANSSQGAQPGKTPHEFLALVSLVGPFDRLNGKPVKGLYRDRLSWVIEFGGLTTDDMNGHTFTNCTGIYLVDATTGVPFHDEISCAPNKTATPVRS